MSQFGPSWTGEMLLCLSMGLKVHLLLPTPTPFGWVFLWLKYTLALHLAKSALTHPHTGTE